MLRRLFFCFGDSGNKIIHDNPAATSSDKIPVVRKKAFSRWIYIGYLLFAFPECQAVFERQCLAKADIPEPFVPVGNQLPVVAYPVVNDMQMRVRRVRAITYCVLSILMHCIYSRAIFTIRKSVICGASFGWNESDMCPAALATGSCSNV